MEAFRWAAFGAGSIVVAWRLVFGWRTTADLGSIFAAVFAMGLAGRIEDGIWPGIGYGLLAGVLLTPAIAFTRRDAPAATESWRGAGSSAAAGHDARLMRVRMLSIGAIGVAYLVNVAMRLMDASSSVQTAGNISLLAVGVVGVVATYATWRRGH